LKKEEGELERNYKKIKQISKQISSFLPDRVHQHVHKEVVSIGWNIGSCIPKLVVSTLDKILFQ
jgi:hypothetical protein